VQDRRATEHGRAHGGHAVVEHSRHDVKVAGHGVRAVAAEAHDPVWAQDQTATMCTSFDMGAEQLTERERGGRIARLFRREV